MIQKRTIRLPIFDETETHELASINLIVEYVVTMGEPESGKYGPPENYDPGSPGAVNLISAEPANELAKHISEEKRAELAAQWIEYSTDDLIAEAEDDAYAAAEEAADRRYEEMRSAIHQEAQR